MGPENAPISPEKDRFSRFLSKKKEFTRNESQDTFDHDKGQKSAISGRHLHWIFLNFLQWIFFPFLQVSLCNLERKWPQNVEKVARFPGGEKSVESCHVCGCHGFFFRT